MANIVITGANGGIGQALVRQYAAAGDRVFAMCRDPLNLTELVAEHKGLVSAHAVDISQDASVQDAIGEIGAERVDILLNAAGVLGPLEPELELGASDWTEWQRVFDVMAFGPLRVLQAVLPHMDAGAKAISLTSQLAASTWPYGGLYPYVGSKAALNRIMRSVAIDLRDRGIIVGVVHPGYVRTSMSGPQADIEPEESARCLRATVAAWTLEQSGDFLKWTGEPHSW